MYADISHWCNDYLQDSSIQLQTNKLKRKIDSKANSLAGLNGTTNFTIKLRGFQYITSIYSFGAGVVHNQTAYCTAKGDGCCVSVECSLSYYAVDRFDDPLDLCQTYGICNDIRNLGGVPFWFGLTCHGKYSTSACKK